MVAHIALESVAHFDRNTHPGASHYIFRSNEADVLREIRAFLKALP
jgi:hypothetical protein